MDADWLTRDVLDRLDCGDDFTQLRPYMSALIEAEKALTHAESYAPEWITERPSPTLLSLRSLLERAR